MSDMRSDERRVRRLEELVEWLKQKLASVEKLALKAAEDGARQFRDDGFGDGPFFWMQSVGVIPGRTGNALGVGTARFLQVIGTSEYLTQPFAMGDVTSPVTNNTGSPTVNNEYLICAYVKDIIVAFVGDCSTASPSRAPDPPA